MEFTLYSPPINLASRNIEFAVCNVIGMDVSTWIMPFVLPNKFRIAEGTLSIPGVVMAGP